MGVCVVLIVADLDCERSTIFRGIRHDWELKMCWMLREVL